jgi:hypothetical protein
MSSFTNSDHYQALNQLLQSEAASYNNSEGTYRVIPYHQLMGMALGFVTHYELNVTVRDVKDIVGDVLAVELDYQQQEYQQAAHDHDTNVFDFYEYITSMAG